MGRISRKDLGAMLLIDGAVMTLIILALSGWMLLSGGSYSCAMALRDMEQGGAVAMASGPLFVLIVKLEEKAGGEVL